MFKRSAFILSAFALAMLLVLAAVIAAQKGANSTAGAPLKGVDVKLGKNPGGSPARRTTDDNGTIDWGPQAAGTYYVEIVPAAKASTANSGDDANYYVLTITGAHLTGGTKKMAWEIKKQQFVSPLSKTARTATPPTYTTKLQFDVGSGPPAPVQTTIVRSKSNITNN